MRDCLRVLGTRDLDHSLRDKRTRDARAEEILVLVNGAGLEHWKNEIASEFFAQIFDDAFRCASLQRFRFQTREFFFLTDICAKGDDLSLIIFLEPMENYRCVESARISEDNFHRCLMFDV